MDFTMFKCKVEVAAEFLWSVCDHGNPSEEQVTEATKSAGLPVTFEGDSFVIDPVRFAVFVAAYCPSNITRGIGVERVISRGFEWMKRRELEIGDSVSA